MGRVGVQQEAGGGRQSAAGTLLATFRYYLQDARGFGRTSVHGVGGVTVAKAMWIAKYGPVPKGCRIFRSCGVRACLAPEHLVAKPVLTGHGQR